MQQMVVNLSQLPTRVVCLAYSCLILADSEDTRVEGHYAKS